MLCVEIKGKDLQSKSADMCLIRCRHDISAAAGFRQTGRGLKMSWSRRLSSAGGDRKRENGKH